ncbi:MAG: hypothetical protein ACTSUS_07880 [Candidatus Freyarchaeota archaeon]
MWRLIFRLMPEWMGKTRIRMINRLYLLVAAEAIHEEIRELLWLLDKGQIRVGMVRWPSFNYHVAEMMREEISKAIRKAKER